ncbi:cytidine deaminase-like protein [Cryomyces antarcticus]|uniref:Cytidine deaminase n=1 Tax=Cryomyces antarcticus TaxID=329879 RepID=A0ABR0LMI6_9PEZI|nr:hypothetical protein LTR60_000562 [Cryomyces antarcticus]KAK5200685.1 hypothetical protein LTR16_005263 [Cryomyces antarcticus]
MQASTASNVQHVSDTVLVYGLTRTELETLGTKCREAKERAYCPYSRFRVGCTLLVSSPSPTFSSSEAVYISGANVENASYPVGTCAERVALGTAVVQGHRQGSFRALAVATDVAPASSPCGMCRQFIREFCRPEMPVFMYDKNGEFVVMTVEQLLPMSFGPESLPPPHELSAARTRS